MSGNGPPCAFHDQSMEHLRATLLDIKEQMREGLAALRDQHRIFSEAITKVMDSQTTRQALCARQAQRLEALENNQAQHRTDHATAREEHIEEHAEFWTAINKLRLIAYIALGFGLVLQMVMPILIVYWLKG
ncbi:MAG: hypothetical protein AB9900_11010 [Humidesulfovibrio sp.]